MVHAFGSSLFLIYQASFRYYDNMRKHIIRIKILLAIFSSMLLMASACKHSKDEPDPGPEPVPYTVERVTIVYAVNRSSLASDFAEDSAEMLRGLAKVDSETNRLLVYSTDNAETASLSEAVNEDGVWKWNRIKEYKRTVTSTDPARLREVLEYACSAYGDTQRTLFFWGHGDSWEHHDSDHATRSGEQQLPGEECYGFGGEYVSNGTDWMDITDLAAAIPDDAFDVIWFDCCYMASAEVAYELRDKARWLVAYPTEVWNSGLNYDDVIPLVMQKEPKLVEAAKSFFNFYDRGSEPVTVAVMDLSRMEELAAAVKSVMEAYPEPSSASRVSNYRRGYSSAGFYDLRQLMQTRCNGDTALMQGVSKALDNLIVYKAFSDIDFNSRRWIDPDLSCMSIHNFYDRQTPSDEFYKTLDWYRRISE